MMIMNSSGKTLLVRSRAWKKLPPNGPQRADGSGVSKSFFLKIERQKRQRLNGISASSPLFDYGIQKGYQRPTTTARNTKTLPNETTTT